VLDYGYYGLKLFYVVALSLHGYNICYLVWLGIGSFSLLQSTHYCFW